MKKIICALLICVISFSFCSCAQLPVPKGINEFLMSNIYTDWDSYSAEKILDKGSAYKNYFDALSENQKKAYNSILSAIYDAADTFPEKIEVPLMESDELTQVYEAVVYDNPEIMCFGKGGSIITEGDLCFFKPEYCMIPAEQTYRIEKMNILADAVLSRFNEKTSDFDKELAIHDYIIGSCTYNSESDDSNTAYACMNFGNAACEGYSKATKFVLEKAGIECYNIIGDAKNQQGENESHMWNIVKIDGSYYYLDTTWDDPLENPAGISHTYFNLSEEEIKADHSNFKSAFVCNSTDANYFVRTGSMFYSSDYYSLKNLEKVISRNLNRGINAIELRFSSKDVYNQALYTLITESKAYEIQNNIKYALPGIQMSDQINYSKNDNYNIIEFIF